MEFLLAIVRGLLSIPVRCYTSLLRFKGGSYTGDIGGSIVKRGIPNFAVLIGLSAFASTAWGQFKLQLFVNGLNEPLQMVQDPTQSNVQYVVQKEGVIRVLVNGVLQSSNFIDLSGSLNQNGEKFLFCLTFAPDYATSGNAYVCYVDNNVQERIQRFKRSAGNPLQLDPTSGTPVIILPTSYDHWGGTMHFGPDGYLYLGLGDGDMEGDPATSLRIRMVTTAR